MQTSSGSSAVPSVPGPVAQLQVSPGTFLHVGDTGALGPPQELGLPCPCQLGCGLCVRSCRPPETPRRSQPKEGPWRNSKSNS